MKLYEWVKCGKCGDSRLVPTSVIKARQDYCPVCKPKTPADRMYRRDKIAEKRRRTIEKKRMLRALVFYAKPGTMPACYMRQVGTRGRLAVGDRLEAVRCDPETAEAAPEESPRGWRVTDIKRVGTLWMHTLEAW